MRLSGQLQTSFFFAKIFRAYKNENQTNHSVRSFYVAFLKIVAFFIFCSLNFILLVGFGLMCIFVRAKSFRKKNWFGVVLITLFYYTTDVYPYQPTYREFGSTHVLLFVIIYDHLLFL